MSYDPSVAHTVEVDDLDKAIAHYGADNYRLDMISPADDPREALLSSHEGSVRLVSRNTAGATRTRVTTNEWVCGRAGMEYRDLIPDRLGGKVIASHIRLNEGGPVPDYVHYHKIAFQVIYCKQGQIRVVYEDQGEPFWLETGDLVLQPPEIRHRVLECTAGAEVIEITSPAEHETWVDHEMELPTSGIDGERLFGERRFFRHRTNGTDARDQLEQELVVLASALRAATSYGEMSQIVTTFSHSLSQT